MGHLIPMKGRDGWSDRRAHLEVAVVEGLFLYLESRSRARRRLGLPHRRRVCVGRSLYGVRNNDLHVGSLLVHHLGATTDP